MRTTLLFCLLIFVQKAIGQNATTFEIEKLSKPENFLTEISSNQLFKLFDAKIEQTAALPDSLVYYGEHAFLSGILNAYKNHRPFVVSPDIIWLLISQGFSRHIFNNSEMLRKEVVNFEHKKILTVVSNSIKLGNPNSDWEGIFPQFTRQISDYTGKALIDVLTADFSTTTPTSKIVSEITVMETFKAYFDYKLMLIACGIPSITILGTVEDWEKIRHRTEYISKYQLKWWTDALVPILDNIIATKKGNFNKQFWMNMAKVHTEKKYGSPTTIDGWIINFFPYTKEGKKTGLKPITAINNLASELVKVPFMLIDNANKQSYKMEFWAGFMGLSQNKNNFALTPTIGWAIVNKSKIDSTNNKNNIFGNIIDDLSISNIITIPEEVYQYKKIDHLHLIFLNKISITTKLSKIMIENLELTGEITPEEIQKVKALFPKTKLTINGNNQ